MIVRDWFFLRGNDTQIQHVARIFLDREPNITNSSLPRVAVEKPASLILENVDLSYNGTYKFLILSLDSTFLIPHTSEVVVYIVGKLFGLH